MAEENAPGIACIGWGSLIWDPQDLPISGSWEDDGPLLPIEFARQSQRDKKMSLVICEGTPRVRTLWAVLDVADLKAAKAVLANREGILNPDARSIGFWDQESGKSHGMEQAVVADWAASRSLGAVVWTNLSWGFEKSRGTMPRGEEVVGYLQALEGTDAAVAEEYVRKAPPQIDTPYRRLIAEALKWTHLP